MVALSGNRDGTSALDYTVHPATGYPFVTGPRGSEVPVNSVLPAWDIAAGLHAAIGLLAAERHRIRAGQRPLVRLALSDVAFAITAGLGRLAQGELGLDDGGKEGNFLYGAFGRDFQTRDGRRVMVVALTPKQWTALKDATGCREAVAALAARTGIDLDTEGGRYAARDDLAAIPRTMVRGAGPREIEPAFAGTGVRGAPTRRSASSRRRIRASARPTRSLPPSTSCRWRCLPTPASPLDFSSIARLPPLPAPRRPAHR